jgi:hypothetical protein
MLHLSHELFRGSVIEDDQLAIFDCRKLLAGLERADKYHLFCVLADIDEAAGAGELGPELANIEIPVRVDLRETQEGDVKSAAVIEIELIRLVDNRLRVYCGAEVQTARRDAADNSRLGCQCNEVDDLLFISDGSDRFGHADAEIDDAVRLQLECRTPRNDFTLAHFDRRQRTRAHSDFAGKGRIVVGCKRLPMVFRLGDHHAVDHYSRDLHLTRIKAAAFDHALDLCDDNTAGITHCHRYGEGFKRKRLAFHGEVALRVGAGPSDYSDVDGKRLVKQAFGAAECHQLDHFLGRSSVEFASTITRIDKSADPHLSDMAGTVRGDIAEKMGDDALRQVVGFDPIGDCELLQLGHQPPVAADDTPDQALVGQMVEPAVFAVALPRSIDEGEIARLAGAMRGFDVRSQVELFERNRDLLGKSYPDESPRRDRVAVADEADGLGRSNDLSFLRVLEIRQCWMLWHLTSSPFPAMHESEFGKRDCTLLVCSSTVA